MYQIIQQGIPMTVIGRLGNDPVVEQTTDGKAYVRLSIAVSAGSKKDEDGNYQNVTHWVSASIWDNGDSGATKAFMEVIENPPSEGLTFKKGQYVVLSADAIPEAKERDGKVYINYRVFAFKHCSRLLTGSSNREDGENTVSSQQQRSNTTNSNKESVPSTPAFTVSKQANDFSVGDSDDAPPF
jgi:single-stranded DNA-binding protein